MVLEPAWASDECRAPALLHQLRPWKLVFGRPSDAARPKNSLLDTDCPERLPVKPPPVELSTRRRPP